MKTKIDKKLILNRLKEALNLTSDTELSNYLGINKSTLSNWYSRNTVDFDLLFSKCEHIDVGWLIYGKKDDDVQYKEADIEVNELKTNNYTIETQLLIEKEERIKELKDMIALQKDRIKELEERINEELAQRGGGGLDAGGDVECAAVG